MRKHDDVPHMSSTGALLRQLSLVACLVACLFPALAGSALAQKVLRAEPVKPASSNITFTPTTGKGNMVVNADELVYDKDSNSTTARGKVQVYYDGRTIEADRLTYFQKTKIIRAIGNIRITEPGGSITYAQELELDQGFRNGFVKAIQIETPERLRLSSPYSTRQDGNITTLEKATYTACEACVDNPTRPPLWQVRAARIIHNKAERMVYFEEARFEFFGAPIAYLPYFSTPDPTVNKKSGLLSPAFIGGDRTGYGVENSYFYNIAPNYDVTLGMVYYSRQGFLPKAEWRHAFENGTMRLNAAGIFQQDAAAFGTEPGNRQFRGYVKADGKFQITDRWIFGWDATVFTDQSFMTDYSLLTYGQSEANIAVFLTGQSINSWFDLRTTRFQGVTFGDNTQRLPITHPQLDYFKTADNPVGTGELSWRANVVSLTRLEADFASRNGTDCTIAANINRVNCLLQGAQGTYTRATVEVAWRKRIIDTFGQVWEPYFAMRGDVAALSLANNLTNATYLGSDDRSTFRAMPVFGLNYRYPWISPHSWGTSTVEPIVQMVVRPNEMRIGEMPNEDSQSLVFDDTNLLSWNKFSGYDRVEGGGRLNYALQYTALLRDGQRFNVLFGQSLHLFGANSYTYGNLDTVSVGANSGLDKPLSDYVGRFQYQPSNKTRFTARGRFDQQTLAVQRGELEASTLWGGLSTSLFYTFIAPQPQQGYLTNRSGVGGAASMRVSEFWTVFGSMRYAFERPAALGSSTTQYNMLDGFSAGLQYLDDCYQLGLFYSRDFNIGSADVQRYMFRFNIRTFGDIGVSQTR